MPSSAAASRRGLLLRTTSSDDIEHHTRACRRAAIAEACSAEPSGRQAIVWPILRNCSHDSRP